MLSICPASNITLHTHAPLCNINRDRSFPSLETSRPAVLHTQASYSMVSSSGIKRPGRYAHHSPPPSAKVKNKRSYTSTSPVCLHGVDRDFTFHLHHPSHTTVAANSDKCQNQNGTNRPTFIIPQAKYLS